MNDKIAIWKRKLAKEKWKNQKDVWEKLNQTAPAVKYIDLESDQSLDDLLKSLTPHRTPSLVEFVVKQFKEKFR